MTLHRIQGTSPYEPRVGYCRAVVANGFVFVSGTTGTDERGRLVDGGAAEQTRQVLRNIADALQRANCDLSLVVALTIHVTDATEFLQKVAPVLREAFAGSPPTMTMVEVRALIDPAMTVEITATAVARA